MSYFQTEEGNALSAMIAQQLFNQILSGELEAKEKLVESTIAEKFSYSRSPVREAIYLLATEGIVERIPRKGAFVREYSEEEIKDLLDIRKHLEYLAADKIKNPSQQEGLLKEIEVIVKEMNLCTDRLKYTHLNYQFHKALMAFSKSETIIEIYNKIALRLLRIQAIHFQYIEDLTKSKVEHEKLYEALKADDVEFIIKMIQSHIGDMISSFRKHQKGLTK